MLQTITLLGGDRRQYHLVHQLRASGFTVSNFAVPGLPDSGESLRNALLETQAVVLPMPALTKERWIRAEAPIPLVSVLECLRPGCKVFGGVLDQAAETLAQYPVQPHDYAKDAALAAANAVPTAEGALQLAMEQLPITLASARCLIIGFGRIGKVLADRLLGMRASVTVAARKAEDRAMAAALGCEADRTGLYLHGLRQYDVVFNTVPAPVLLQEHLSALAPDCLIVDLATGGGLAEALTNPVEPRYILAPGLPGKVAPVTAAEVVRRSILDTLSA